LLRAQFTHCYKARSPRAASLSAIILDRRLCGGLADGDTGLDGGDRIRYTARPKAVPEGVDFRFEFGMGEHLDC
jgi:hypothetical protein